MQHLEVSGAVRHIYVVRRQRVNICSVNMKHFSGYSNKMQQKILLLWKMFFVCEVRVSHVSADEDWRIRRIQNVILLTIVAHLVQVLQCNMLRSLMPGLTNFNLEESHLIHNDSFKGCTKLLNFVKHK
jgi:hypothetical protein